MTVELREATEGDVPALLDLYHAAYRSLEELSFPSSVLDADPERVQAWLRDRTLLVATMGGTIVGVVQVIPRSDWETKEIGRLAVAPEHQERGIGKRLLEAAEQHVASEGYDTVRLRTFTGHPFLESWYEQDGYERVGREVLDDRPYDALIMEKTL